MQLDFWFDPICPFTWNTSRWAVNAAGERDLEITWRPFSLAIKNGDSTPEQYREPVQFALGLVRVTQALIDAGQGQQVGDAYREWGRRIHQEQQHTFDVADSLVAAGIDPSFATAADDPSIDAAINASMDEALGLGGDDVGVPIIAWDHEGTRVGFFGPVVMAAPEGAEAGALWDLVVASAAFPELTELKRRRSGDLTLAQP